MEGNLHYVELVVTAILGMLGTGGWWVIKTLWSIDTRLVRLETKSADEHDRKVIEAGTLYHEHRRKEDAQWVQS
jgi:hypothetical protein